MWAMVFMSGFLFLRSTGRESRALSLCATAARITSSSFFSSSEQIPIEDQQPPRMSSKTSCLSPLTSGQHSPKLAGLDRTANRQNSSSVRSIWPECVKELGAFCMASSTTSRSSVSRADACLRALPCTETAKQTISRSSFNSAWRGGQTMRRAAWEWRPWFLNNVKASFKKFLSYWSSELAYRSKEALSRIAARMTSRLLRRASPLNLKASPLVFSISSFTTSGSSLRAGGAFLSLFQSSLISSTNRSMRTSRQSTSSRAPTSSKNVDRSAEGSLKSSPSRTSLCSDAGIRASRAISCLSVATEAFLSIVMAATLAPDINATLMVICCDISPVRSGQVKSVC
mmetsp:Transcript_28591/g.62194  ORF Transcript_28591/g.62194 Transcript_28591/m.62194 type:complete len:342 (+) Transcript_28591:974-1999(+)